jgi:anti-anti-sigma regulatory factor/PAS domain-containing protein
MDRSLLFDACPEPLAVVVGDVIRDQNPAWTAAVGPAASLVASFAPGDESVVRRALSDSASRRVDFVARLAAGPLRGESIRCTSWSAGGEERCLRLDGPAAEAAPAVDVAEIPRSKEKALLWDDNLREVHHAQNLLRIVNELPMIVWAMTSDGICTLSAGKGLADLGLEPGKLVGRNMFEFYAEQPAVVANIRRALAGESFTTEITLTGIHWRTSHHVAHDGQGNVTGLFAVTEDVTAQVRDRERIHEQLELIQTQKRAIDQLVSPILEVWRGVLVVPFIGELAAERAAVVTERLLAEVVRHAARFAILDLTGIDLAESSTAQHLFNIMGGVDLLGCTALISGIRPSVAMTMVSLGIDIPAGRAFSTLAEALRVCMRSPGTRSG